MTTATPNTKIEILTFAKAGFLVNGQHYLFRTIFLDPKNGTTLPSHLHQANRAGGLEFDVDRYGNMEKAWTTARADLGDILIVDPNQPAQDQKTRSNSNRQTFESAIIIQEKSGVKSPIDPNRKTIKIRDAMRSCFAAMFPVGQVHQVKMLEIGISHGVLRLPAGLQLEIQTLCASRNGNNIINAIAKILSKSSFPIQLISANVTGPNDPIFKNNIFRTCKSVQFEILSGGGKWAETLLRMKQPKIQLFGKNEIPMSDVLILAKNWMETRREIGHVFSMTTKKVQQRLAWIKEKLDAREVVLNERSCTKYPRAVSVPINTDLELNFYIQEQPYSNLRSDFPDLAPFMIVMEMMKAGSAEPMNYCKYWYMTF